jgi:hypothetical protein
MLRIAAAKSAASSVNLASRLSAPSRCAARSTHFGSATKRPLRERGSGIASFQVKSFVALSQASAPSVTAINNVSALSCSSQ